MLTRCVCAAYCRCCVAHSWIFWGRSHRDGFHLVWLLNSISGWRSCLSSSEDWHRFRRRLMKWKHNNSSHLCQLIETFHPYVACNKSVHQSFSNGFSSFCCSGTNLNAGYASLCPPIKLLTCRDVEEGRKGRRCVTCGPLLFLYELPEVKSLCQGQRTWGEGPIDWLITQVIHIKFSYYSEVSEYWVSGVVSA